MWDDETRNEMIRCRAKAKCSYGNQRNAEIKAKRHRSIHASSAFPVLKLSSLHSPVDAHIPSRFCFVPRLVMRCHVLEYFEILAEFIHDSTIHQSFPQSMTTSASSCLHDFFSLLLLPTPNCPGHIRAAFHGDRTLSSCDSHISASLRWAGSIVDKLVIMNSSPYLLLHTLSLAQLERWIQPGRKSLELTKSIRYIDYPKNGTLGLSNRFPPRIPFVGA